MILDSEKAEKAGLVQDQQTNRLIRDYKRVEAALETQAQQAVDAAVAREREESRGEYEMVAWVLGNMVRHAGFTTYRDTGIAGIVLPLAERYMVLVALVREWQEARLSPDLNADHAERYFKARTALAAFDVEGG